LASADVAFGCVPDFLAKGAKKTHWFAKTQVAGCGQTVRVPGAEHAPYAERGILLREACPSRFFSAPASASGA
jgi:hypothetical protein